MATIMNTSKIQRMIEIDIKSTIGKPPGSILAICFHAAEHP